MKKAIKQIVSIITIPNTIERQRQATTKKSTVELGIAKMMEKLMQTVNIRKEVWAKV